MIVEATTPADVRNAVITARTLGVPFAVYATGHGGALPERDDVVVARTSTMDGVLVDPDRRTAWVGPGTRWGAVIEAAAPFGLAPLAGTSPTVGVIGYTLGGGMGWLSRRYGFAADSVVRAEVVTADGELRTVSADHGADDHDADLFWALRGAGANFGAVTGLEFRLHPVSTVYAGVATFAPDRAADVLAYYRDSVRPDALTANIVLTKDALAIRGMYAGPAEAARRALAPLWRVAGTPVTDGWRAMPYTESGTIGGTAPHQFSLLRDLPDAVIAASIEAARNATVEVRQWGGALARPGVDAGPIGHRDVPFSVVIDGQADPVIEAHATGGSFLNWLHDRSRTHTAYTAGDLARLRDLKATYDPDNTFGLAKNLAPITVRQAA
jgi:FAD/FMN-containing dehydrogenase